MIFTSPYENLAIPQDKTLWDFLELHARSSENAHAPAFICSVSERQVNFSQMLMQAEQICAGLHARGIKKGDVRTVLLLLLLYSILCCDYRLWGALVMMLTLVVVYVYLSWLRFAHH